VALLDSAANFPAGPFASEEALAALQRLGLRSTVSTATLLDSARSTAELAAHDQKAAQARFDCLLLLAAFELYFQTRTKHGSFCSRFSFQLFRIL
jgi:hypothetical protein